MAKAGKNGTQAAADNSAAVVTAVSWSVACWPGRHSRQCLARALRRADPQELRRAAGHPARRPGDLIELAVHRAGADLGDYHPGAREIRAQRLAETVHEMLAG